MRVHELAKKLGRESRVLIPELVNIGIPVSSHGNSLSEEQVQKALKKLAEKPVEATIPRKRSGSLKTTAKKSLSRTPKSRGETKAKDESKTVAEEVPKPEKKRILIKRRKEDVEPQPETIALTGEEPSPESEPQAASVTQELPAEPSPSDALPSVDGKPSPVAVEPAATRPEKEKAVVDEKKGTGEGKPKKILKGAHPSRRRSAPSPASPPGSAPGPR